MITATPHAGLLPAGFSAEHFGPNDYYYWDDFWGIAGLYSAAKLCAGLGDHDAGRHFLYTARVFEQAVARSLDSVANRLGYPVLAASPYRRMDAGAIGSLVLSPATIRCERCPPARH